MVLPIREEMYKLVIIYLKVSKETFIYFLEILKMCENNSERIVDCSIVTTKHQLVLAFQICASGQNEVPSYDMQIYIL